MKTVVIGGGPSGMIAAYFRAAGGDETTLIERNEKLGKKLYITGKGRCNVTNSCTAEEFLSGVVTNPKFLAGAIRRFTPEDFKEFIERKTPLKVERGNRVFPESDKASDITKCLESYMREAGVSVRLSERVVKIEISNGKVAGVVTDKGRIPCDEAIVCTGGVSYPSTGSTGDGYAFARAAGHTVVSPKAALVGIDLAGDKYKSLQGVSLKNIRITAFSGDKKVFEDFGEMAFTYFGISGPVVLSASSYLNKCDLKGVKIFVDLKPALSEETLDARVLRDFEKYKNKRVKNSLDDLL
ncbi:MAG: aminoacetone oxidase family FAD-binding enzyme, partial [Clostridia bacterium]|nr:aminoacetone oxidase family FAD-binding enzyme [Clostridia bacterium]